MHGFKPPNFKKTKVFGYSSSSKLKQREGAEAVKDEKSIVLV